MIAQIFLSEILLGALIFAAAWVVARFIPYTNSTTRYAVWFTALLALASAPVWSAISQSPTPTSANVKSALISLQGTAGATGVSPRSWFLPVHVALPASITLGLIIIWLLGASVAVARLVWSYVRIRRFRRDAVLLNGTKEIFVSEQLAIPIVAGLFAPVIIVPAALVDELDDVDLDRIIAHECAHLRRNDIVGNAFQRFVEAILFFNPWVHLIGHQLITEREAACDDWVVEDIGDVERYADSLATLARSMHHWHAPLVAPSAFGSHHAMVARIDRLINGGTSRRLTINYFALGGAIMIFVGLAFALQIFSPVFASTGIPIANAPRALVASRDSACTTPNANAKVLVPATPEFPASAMTDHAMNATAIVSVSVAASGKLASAHIYRTSGRSDIDASALETARRNTYSPAVHDCKPVKGTYLFRVDYNSGPAGPGLTPQPIKSPYPVLTSNPSGI